MYLPPTDDLKWIIQYIAMPIVTALIVARLTPSSKFPENSNYRDLQDELCQIANQQELPASDDSIAPRSDNDN
jgi:hypothetical protein